MDVKTKMDVKVLMLRKGVTQESLAKKLGTSQEAVSSVYRGRTKTERIRVSLAKALGVPVGTLARALDWPDAPGRRAGAPEKVA